MNGTHLMVIARNEEPDRPTDKLLVRRQRRRMRLEPYWHREPVHLRRGPDDVA